MNFPVISGDEVQTMLALVSQLDPENWNDPVIKSVIYKAKSLCTPSVDNDGRPVMLTSPFQIR